jgi:hypothetical protein
MQDEWRFDTIPEFMDGKNTMDFFDADIEERLRALEEEEVRTMYLLDTTGIPPFFLILIIHAVFCGVVRRNWRRTVRTPRRRRTRRTWTRRR